MTYFPYSAHVHRICYIWYAMALLEVVVLLGTLQGAYTVDLQAEIYGGIKGIVFYGSNFVIFFAIFAN